jgi:GNAT superfamily N-acetyltransferase
MKIREAAQEDMQRLLEMRRRSYEQANFDELLGPFNEDHFRMVFGTSLSAQDGTTWLLVAEEDGRVFGATFGVLCPVWLYPDAVCASELFIWVEPEMRGRGAGEALVKSVEEWAKIKGADFVSMFSFPHLDPARMRHVCAKRGYSEMETNHVRRI